MNIQPHVVERGIAFDTDDGLHLAGTQTGAGTHGIKIVLVHGLLTDSNFWAEFVAALAPQVREVADIIAFDARGHGQSGRPPRRSSSTLEVFAGDLGTVLRSLPDQVLLVGHSMGSSVITEYARKCPDDYTRQVRSLVLFNVAGELPVWKPLHQVFMPATAMLRPLRHRRLLDRLNALGHNYLQHRFRRLSAAAAPGRAQLVPSKLPVDPRALADMCTGLVEYRATAEHTRVMERTPVRIVTGEYDRVISPDQSARFAAAIGGAHFEIVPDVGHSLPLTHPGIAAGVVVAALTSMTEMVEPATARSSSGPVPHRVMSSQL